MLGLPFVVFSVANCITLEVFGVAVSSQDHALPGLKKKKSAIFAGVNDTSVVTHKQTFNRQATKAHLGFRPRVDGETPWSSA